MNWPRIKYYFKEILLFLAFVYGFTAFVLASAAGIIYLAIQVFG